MARCVRFHASLRVMGATRRRAGMHDIGDGVESSVAIGVRVLLRIRRDDRDDEDWRPLYSADDLNGLWRSLDSALDWGSRGRGFKSRQPDEMTKSRPSRAALVIPSLRFVGPCMRNRASVISWWGRLRRMKADSS